VCLSARRAVAILKELAPLKVRSAKLFPKNGSVTDQQRQLGSAAFGIAVGTPHRLCQLLAAAAVDSAGGAVSTQGANDGGSTSGRSKNAPSDSSKNGPLSLEHSRLLIFDCYVSQKQYTVCTLPDTAPHCAMLVREYVVAPWWWWSKKDNQATGHKVKSRCQIAFL
jgi:hypothetical protein